MPEYRLRDGLKDASRLTVFGILGAIVTVIVGLVFVLMAVYGFGVFSQKTANFRGETQKKNQVEGNGSYRIAAYDHFFDLCAAVQTDETMIANTKRDIKQTKDPARLLQLQTNLTAQQNNRAGDINTYNADAKKSYTEGQFRSSDLPFQLDINAEETSCTAS